MDYDPFGHGLPSEMDYKCLVHDCMWSGTSKEDNFNETNNKLSDLSFFSTSPMYSSIFDIFNIDDENSLGEIEGDNDDYDDEEDLPLSGLSGDSGDEHKVINNSHIKDHSYGNNKSSMCLTGSVATTSATTEAALSSKTSKISLSSEPTILFQRSSNQLVPPLSDVVGSSLERATSTVTSSIITPTPSISTSATPKTSGKSRNPKSSCPDLSKKKLSFSSSTIIPTTSTTVKASNSILKSTGKPRNPKSLYPERRKEHNNSEKKRRDHLRNAFNHLRDQIPKLKDGEKKAARVTILKEATSYVNLLKEKHHYLERTRTVELINKENLVRRLKILQTGVILSAGENIQLV